MKIPPVDPSQTLIVNAKLGTLPVRVKEEHKLQKLIKDKNDESNPHINTSRSISTPTGTDVLCGKDKACVAHEGSKYFRKKIGLNYERYQACTTKQEKMNITKDIVEELQQSYSSRFLKYDIKSKSWQEISQMAARDKVSHALRFASQKQQKKQTKECKQGTSAANLPPSSSKNALKKKSLPTKAQVKSITKKKSCLDPIKNKKDAEIWQEFVRRQQELMAKIHSGYTFDIPTSQPPYPTQIENYPVYINCNDIMNGPILAFEMYGEPTD